MPRPFFIVGPTGTGKSELAAQVALRVDAEIVNADAFQIYQGLDLLTAKPSAATMATVPHHLLSSVSLSEQMNVEKFRVAALDALQQIASRRKRAIVVGGTGLYIKSLTHGLSRLPPADPALREELNRVTTGDLQARLAALDPDAARTVDQKNRQRLIRALEVCLLTGAPFSAQRTMWRKGSIDTNGVLLFWERVDLYERINRRVEQMFAAGVVAEVQRCGAIGVTAEKTLGLRDIRVLLAGEISEKECIARIQQASRQYAKRQLTWFRGQDNLTSLNLSLHSSPEAIDFIAQNAGLTFAQPND